MNLWEYCGRSRREKTHSYIGNGVEYGSVANVTVEDPDEYRKSAPVDDRGRVTVGRQYAGKKVNVVIEVVDE